MADGNGSVTAILVGAIASMAGFIVWLFRFVIATQNARIEKLEGEQAAAINANTAAIAANTDAVKEMLGIIKTLADILIEQAPRHQYRATITDGNRGGD